MKRRSFVQALAAAVGAATLVPFVQGAERVTKGVIPDRIPAEAEADISAFVKAPEVKSPAAPFRVCANCGRHSARFQSAVCSPLCNWYTAEPLIGKLGIARWEDWRERSIAFLLGAALTYEQYQEFVSPQFQEAKRSKRMDPKPGGDHADAGAGSGSGTRG